jgi:hypothetical protein
MHTGRSAGVIEVNRRTFLSGAAAIGVMPCAAANKLERRRFRTPDFEIEMTVEYHDRYGSSGFWFRQEDSGRQFCLSARGEEDRRCLAAFRGSLAIAQYRVRPRSPHQAAPAPSLREHVRTVDRDARLRDRPPFDRAIELTKGIGSDLQAFGYEAPEAEEDRLFRLHGPWYLFRQDLFLEPPHTPFLTIFWKHALSSIRVLDIIPAVGTLPVDG